MTKNKDRLRKVFTTGQAAKVCRVAPRTVTKWMEAGRLGGYLIPGSNHRRISREQLVRFMRDNGFPLGDLVDAEVTYKVLLVGVSRSVAAALADLLPWSDGFRLEPAQSLFHAGTLAQTFQPDAVVVDLSVGRGDGCQVALSLRARDGVRVVALAGEDETDPDGLTGYGFGDVLQSPVNVADLAARLTAFAAAREGS